MQLIEKRLSNSADSSLVWKDVAYFESEQKSNFLARQNQVTDVFWLLSSIL